MFTTTANALALVRFGGFHGGRGGGGDFVLLLVGVLFAGALIWAISRPNRTSA
jgi:hypothetical protein